MRKGKFMGKISVISMALALFMCAACSTTPVSLSSTITPMDDKVITENLGRVEGTDSAFSILGLFMIGTPDIDMAINNALKVKGGDTLVNVHCYEVYRYYLFFSTNTVLIQGYAVKTADANKRGVKK